MGRSQTVGRMMYWITMSFGYVTDRVVGVRLGSSGYIVSDSAVFLRRE